MPHWLTFLLVFAAIYFVIGEHEFTVPLPKRWRKPGVYFGSLITIEKRDAASTSTRD